MAFQLPAQLQTLWTKFQGWFSGEVKAAEAIFSTEEQAVISAFQPILHAAEAVTLASLIAFIRNVLTTVAASTDLATIEAKVLNELEVEGGQLFTIAKGMGSNLLQATIGVLLAGMPKG